MKLKTIQGQEAQSYVWERNYNTHTHLKVANKYREIPKPEIKKPVAEETSDEKVTPKNSRPRKKGVLAKGLSSIFSGTFLTSDKTLKHLPYILFLAVIAILYIANGYYADDKIRQMNKLSNEIKEKHSEYISTTSELMFISKQSEVAKAAEGLGLKEPVVPPAKIVVDSTRLFNKKNKSGE